MSDTGEREGYDHAYLRAVGGPLRRRMPSVGYLAMLAVVAGAMLLLPLIYLGLIGLVGWGVWWHAVNDVGVFTSMGKGSGAAKLALLIYVTPIVAGVVMMAFMIKPLFAPVRDRHAPQAMNRQDEPLLFAFVDRLCDTVGAPRPGEIHIDMDLNASARFDGWWRGVLGGRMILTVGLPLVAGMNLNQFAGVLAHEFGHFAQRGAMRLSYVIRTINGWFARVVYERDGWDEALENAATDSEHSAITLVAQLCRAMVWVSRRVLWVLMMTGHLLSSLLLRRMEFDADRCAGRTVGAGRAAETLAALPALGVAMQATYGQLSAGMGERRLPADMPRLVANRVRELTADDRAAVAKDMREEKGSWFDSHPTTPARVSALRALEGREEYAGVFDVEAEASSLFAQFDVVSKLMTRQYYQEVLGPKAGQVKLVEVEKVEAQREERKKKAASLETYLGGLAHPARLLPLPDVTGVTDEPERLLSCRAALQRRMKAAREAVKVWEEADGRSVAVATVSAMKSGNVKKLDLKSTGLAASDDRTLREAERDAAGKARAAREVIERALTAAMARTALALKLTQVEAPGRPVEETYDVGNEQPGGVVAMRQAYATMVDAGGVMGRVRELYHKQEALLAHAQDLGRDERFVEEVLRNARAQSGLLAELRSALRGTGYPYAEGRRMSLSQFVVPELPNSEDVGGVMNASLTALRQGYGVSMRLLADLTSLAEAGEEELGLPVLELGEAKDASAAK